MPIKAPERSERWVRNINTEAMPHEKFSVGGANGLLLQDCPSGAKSWLVRLRFDASNRLF